MTTVRTAKVRRCVVLHNVNWRAYQAIGRALADRPALRLTYDRGELEIATTTVKRQRIKRVLSRLLDAWTEEREVVVAGYGSMTLMCRQQRCGLEPDECYWVGHEPQMRGRDRIDFRFDPPPDLVFEIDTPRSDLDRLRLYGVLGVPEVWRYGKGKLEFRARQSDGGYAETTISLSLPPLKPADLTPFLAMRGEADENTIIRRFRSWIRQRFPPGVTPSER